MRKKYLAIRVLIVLFLLLPFLLKSIDRFLEPYPAILFPAGGKKVKAFDGNITVHNELEYYLVLKSGETIKIDLMEAFNNLPNNRVKALLNKDFGLTRNSNKPFKVNIASNVVMLDLQKKLPESKIEEGKTWLKEQLGYSFNIDKENIINLRVDNCKTYRDITNESKEIKKECFLKKSISLI